MIGITLKHMRYFLALATHRHFGRAADACAISQPALSLQIKELETMLGGPLVERSARSFNLTPLGEEFLARAKDILIRVNDLEELVRSSKDTLSGRLRLGIIPTVAPYLLPEIITALGDRYPDLELQPRESVTQSLVDSLLSSRLDVAIVALPISEPSVSEFALFDEEFLLVRPSRDAGKPVPSPKSLKAMRLLLLEEGHCFRDQALSFCDISDAKPGHIMEGSSLSTLVQMVSAGIGATLIPEMALGFETRSADVCIARFNAPPPKRTIGMIWRKASPLADALMTVGAIIRKTAEEKDRARTLMPSAEVLQRAAAGH